VFYSLVLFLGDYLIFFTIIPLFYFWQKDRKLFFKLIFAVALAKLIETGLNLLYPTPRPYEATPISPLLRMPIPGSDASFPSGHTSAAAAFAATVFLKYKKLGIIFLILAVLIGTARVIGGVHYPIDILGGVLVGILSALFVSKSKIYFG